MDLLRANPLDALLFVERLAVVANILLYLLPVGGPATIHFNLALLFYAAACSLRLYQRVGLGFSRAYLESVTKEDSFHYVLYCLLLFRTRPTVIAVVPIAVYTGLQCCNYLLKLLNGVTSGLTSVKQLLAKANGTATDAFRIAANAELFLLAFKLAGTLSRLNVLELVNTVCYCIFLQMRFLSRRNPSSRNSWRDLRATTDGLFTHPRCPGFIRSLYPRLIGGVDALLQKFSTLATSQARPSSQ